MRGKEPVYRCINLLNTTGGNNVKSDTTAKQIVICELNSASPVVPYAPPIPFGTYISTEIFTYAAEVRQMATIGAETTKETVVASQVYTVKIGSPLHKYESKKGKLIPFSYRAPATLSGTAATDRAALYTSLVTKINAYSENWVTAYNLTQATYTGGTSSGNAATNFILGETVTQETSTLTAKVAKCDIDTGTFYGDDAAGTIWLYDLDATDATWLVTQKTLTAAGTVAGVSTNCVVTVTNATTVHNVGILLIDDAGYFTSHPERYGRNHIYIDGFSVDAVEYGRAATYPLGVGSEMVANQPVYSRDGNDLVSGKREYDFEGVVPSASLNYNKIVIRYKGSNEDMDGQKEDFTQELVLYVSTLNTSSEYDEFVAALAAAFASYG